MVVCSVVYYYSICAMCQISMQLDPDRYDAVKELHIVDIDISNERYLYAATNSGVYRLPLQRCSRLQGCK